jgi:molecular chaperone HtpG
MKELLNSISDPDFTSRLKESEKQITPILQTYLTNFPDFTDHSIHHSKRVLNYATLILNNRLEYLNDDEKYILIMAGYLHDVGMCLSSKEKQEIMTVQNFKSEADCIEYIRNIHNELSLSFVDQNWISLRIPNKKYAKAIGLVAMGHRKVDLFDFDTYDLEFIVKGGNEFVCLPYLAAILRLADELDITNDRTPDLLFNKYYPSNPISKNEWDKHKSNYFVNFKNDKIIITAECNDLNIYYGLIEQKNKIESALKDLHKLTRLLPPNRNNLAIEFHHIEQNIETKGFIPKKIGFSFDFKNTFDAFIGRNLYDSDFVAIREVVQNAIDTCLYKKSLIKTYKPIINIQLNDKCLTIEDNGLGMDYFIIENYFAKLNSSFYQRSNVSQNYESIGQFGVGVFAYFLLCDYFDVETKSSQSESIKFRVTKDAENSFYFFDDTNKSEDGTKITLYVNSTLEFGELIKQIEFYFPFIDVPLNLSDNKGNLYRVSKKQFRHDKFKILSENVKFLAKNRIPELDIITSKLNTESFEGVVSMFIILKNNEISPEGLYNIIDKYSHTNYAIYQKGIFVSRYRSIFLHSVTGSINLKRKVNLNISRSQFKDNDYIINVLTSFEINIIKQMFEKWEKKSYIEKYEIVNYFINEYVNVYQYNAVIYDLLKENWILKVYYNFSIKYMSLKEIFQLESFILMHEFSSIRYFDSISEKQMKELFEGVNKHIVLIYDEYAIKKLIKISELSSFKLQFIKGRYNHYIEILPGEKFIPYTNSLLKQCYPFANDNSIIAYPRIGVDRYFNSNNQIIKYIIENSSFIYNNTETKQLFEGLIEHLSEFTFNFSLKPWHYSLVNAIKKANFILSHINAICKENFSLKKDDFPTWIIDEEKKKTIK